MGGGRTMAGEKVLMDRSEMVSQSCTHSITVVRKGQMRVIVFLIEKKETLWDVKKTGVPEEP